jgi:hypothetical protein
MQKVEMVQKDTRRHTTAEAMSIVQTNLQITRIFGFS